LQTALITPHNRVLPLPPLHFNHLTGSLQTKEAELTTYARKLFHPLRHEHLFSDFPGFLHQAATVLAGTPRRSRTGGGIAADTQATTAEAAGAAKQIKGVARAPMSEADAQASGSAGRRNRGASGRRERCYKPPVGLGLTPPRSWQARPCGEVH
jgi:hypothetical protein